MKRLIVFIVACFLAGSALAQQNQTPTLADRAVSASITVAKNLWARVQKEGRPLANKLLKAAPEYYKGAQAQLQSLIKRVDKADIPKTFSEKQQLALEVWRLRGAINVLSLSDPAVLQSLLNYRPEAIEKMQKDLQQTETKLKKANLPGI